MSPRLLPGEIILAMRSESLRASTWRLGLCALLLLFGWTSSFLGVKDPWGMGAQWAAVLGAIWSEAERASTMLWLTNQRMIVHTGIFQGVSVFPLGLMGPFGLDSIPGPPQNAAWITASTPDGSLQSRLMLADRASAFLVLAENARTQAVDSCTNRLSEMSLID